MVDTGGSCNGVLRTERLVLRRWRTMDAEAMATINQDPRVTEFLNRPMHEAAVAGFHRLVTGHWAEHGFGFFAVEAAVPLAPGAGTAISARTFLGFVGVAYPVFLPEVAHRPELGWRLAPAAWGRGLATEAALAARDHARADRDHGGLGLPDLISVIHPANVRSQSVAQKVGMVPERQVWNPHLGLQVDVWSRP